MGGHASGQGYSAPRPDAWAVAGPGFSEELSAGTADAGSRVPVVGRMMPRQRYLPKRMKMTGASVWLPRLVALAPQVVSRTHLHLALYPVAGVLVSQLVAGRLAERTRHLHYLTCVIISSAMKPAWVGVIGWQRWRSRPSLEGWMPVASSSVSLI